MDDLIFVVQLYFQKVSSANVLDGELSCRNFNREDFMALSLCYLQHLSETETNELYRFLKSGVTCYNCEENGLNVFRALKELVKGLLLVRENQPVCRYDKLLQWHELTGSIGEDLPVCAFLAERTEIGAEREWQDFEWSTVIGHDNMQLNRIMQKGLSDNHFHLFGSAPTFKLLWIKLMNDLDDTDIIRELKKVDEEKRMSRVKYSTAYKEEPLEVMHFQAALIRLTLVAYIDDVRGKAPLEDKIDYYRPMIQKTLSDHDLQNLYRQRVQNELDRRKILMRIRSGDASADYANLGYTMHNMNHDFEGERALMYYMLLGRVGEKKIPEFLLEWFYAYLVIRTKFREEFVQINSNIGFENFDRYNKRKQGFLGSDADMAKMVQHAVCGSFETKNIHSLELRVTPGKTMMDNWNGIRTYDSFIKKSGLISERQMKSIYYVFHFPKKKDEETVQQEGYMAECRHYNFRLQIERQAEELIRFRENAPEEASRVLGIDACAKEIGCRPEVFGSVFRRLTAHVKELSPIDYIKQCEARNCENRHLVKQWKMTYHVGEDWLDFADGLRAIDEAVLFLNMKNGDRLGHATALGLDAGKWYGKKHNRICLPLQDYLDNVVWLYHKLIEFNIPDCEALKGFLSNEFEKNFRILYLEYMDAVARGCGIGTYYEAWKLRGDHPFLYKNRELSAAYSLFYPYWVNENIPYGSKIRNRKEVVDLLFYYHYSAEVRHKGEESKCVELSDLYVDGIVKVQKAMQEFIAERGIGIEANPSSNYMISTMESYDEHPIVNLYNLGLVVDPKEIEACTQMHISINTDDKGVFWTSLENEYALMGCALEHVKDENGNKKYHKQMVYEWLDRIRENGDQQSFLERIQDHLS